MGKLTATCFITLDNVIEEPHRWSGAYFSDETGKLNVNALKMVKDYGKAKAEEIEPNLQRLAQVRELMPKYLFA